MDDSEEDLRDQLLFNLEVPVSSHNLATGYRRKPQPVVVEKLGRGPRRRAPGRPRAAETKEPIRFSLLSREKLASALVLAQRDLKKKKDRWERGGRQVSPCESPSPSKVKIVYGKEYREKLKNKKEKPKSKLKVRETGGQKTRTVEVQTHQNTESVSRPKPDSDLPATTNSPPTRDKDSYSLSRFSREGHAQDEIRRLRIELESYIYQIENMAINVLQGSACARSRHRRDSLSDDESENVKLIRAKEHTIRTTRQLYVLRRQVQGLQRELSKTNMAERKTKKNPAILQLASAHRGAAKVMQGIMSQVSNNIYYLGLPPSYDEISRLLRQLTNLCFQVDPEGGLNRNDNVQQLLDRVDTLNKEWNLQQNLRLKSGQFHDDFKTEQRAEAMKLAERQNVSCSQTHKRKNTRVLSSKRQVIRRGRLSAEQGMTPERRAVLREGLTALAQAQRRDAEKSRPFCMRENQRGKQKVIKSVIFPADIQAQRSSRNQTLVLENFLSHYADPTVASTLRAEGIQKTEPKTSSAPSSPSWKPAGILNRKGLRKLNRSHSLSPRPNKPSSYPDVDGFGNRVVRQLTFDEDESAKQEYFKELKSEENELLNWLHRERASKLGPKPEIQHIGQFYTDVTRESKSTADNLLAGEQSLRRRLLEKAEKNVSVNADILSEMILNDLLQETTAELQRLEQEETAGQGAMSLRNASTFETIHQRLQEMEKEQLEIRQRWVTLSYSDPEQYFSQVNKGGYISDAPTSPVAIKITRSDVKGQILNSYPTGKTDLFEEHLEERPLMFTKPVLQEKWCQSRIAGPSDLKSSTADRPSRPLASKKKQLYLPKETIRGVHMNRDSFDRYLKQTACVQAGDFDPWTLSEQISNDIFEDCVDDVRLELEDMSDELVNLIYNTEFLTVKSSSSSSSSPECTNSPVDDVH